MRYDYQEHPINPLPPVVWLLVAPIILGEILFGLGHAGLAGEAATAWRIEALQRFAFDPEMLRRMVAQNEWPWRGVARLFTYSFVHASLTHAAMAGVFILALGKFVGEIFRGWAVAAVFLVSALVGALVYAAMPFTHVALYGAYPGAYGLIGAFTWILWVRVGGTPQHRAQAFSLIGMLAAVQLIFAAIFGASPDWIAEFAGFAAGFGMSFLVGPGGWRRTLDRLRRR